MTQSETYSGKRRWPWWAIALSVLAAAWVLLTISGVAVVGIDKLRFTRHKLEQGFEIWVGWRTLLFIHAVSAAVAIATGTASFILKHHRNWQLHRWLGTSYVLAVAVSAAASFPLASTATGGPVSVAGFIVLGFGWTLTTGIAYQTARKKDFENHSRWMIRSYAFSLTNTTFHLILVPLTAYMGDRTSAYQLSVWLCMVINWSLAELAVRNQQ